MTPLPQPPPNVPPQLHYARTWRQKQDYATWKDMTAVPGGWREDTRGGEKVRVKTVLAAWKQTPTRFINPADPNWDKAEMWAWLSSSVPNVVWTDFDIRAKVLRTLIGAERTTELTQSGLVLPTGRGGHLLWDCPTFPDGRWNIVVEGRRVGEAAKNSPDQLIFGPGSDGKPWTNEPVPKACPPLWLPEYLIPVGGGNRTAAGTAAAVPDPDIPPDQYQALLSKVATPWVSRLLTTAISDDRSQALIDIQNRLLTEGVLTLEEIFQLCWASPNNKFKDRRGGREQIWGDLLSSPVQYEKTASKKGQPPPVPETPPLIADWMTPGGGPLTDDMLPDWWIELRRIAEETGESFTLILGAYLVRVASHIHPNYVLPPLPVPAPLNLFAMLVGEPSSGKSVANTIAEDLLPYSVYHAQEAYGVPAVSGQAVADAFLEVNKKGKKVRRPEWSVMFYWDEGAELAALLSNDRHATAPVLRKGWSGGDLGQMAATKDARRFVEGGTYRLTLLVGVQPSVPLKEIREDDTGMSSRFIAFPPNDARGAETALDQEGGGGFIADMGWSPPPISNIIAPIPTAPDVIAEVRRFRRAERIRWQMDAYEGERLEAAEALVAETVESEDYKRIYHGKHTVQQRLRVAAVLAAASHLERKEFKITETDWITAWSILALSKQTLDHYDGRVAAAEEAKAQTQAKARGRSDITTEAVKTAAREKAIDDLLTELCEEAENRNANRPEGAATPKPAKMWPHLNSRKRRHLHRLLGGTKGAASRAWRDELRSRGKYFSDT